MNPWYVTGFTEGEGAFTYSRSGKQLSLYFAIKLTASERALLEEIQRFFGGIGTIYRVRARAAPTPRSGFTKTAAYYRVCRRDELPVIVRHFEEYPLRGAKAEAFTVWREMVGIKQEFRSPDRVRLEHLRSRLSSLSSRNLPWSASAPKKDDSDRRQ